MYIFIKEEATTLVLRIKNNGIVSTNFQIKECVGISSDGDQTISGRYNSLQAFVKKVFKEQAAHCMKLQIWNNEIKKLLSDISHNIKKLQIETKLEYKIKHRQAVHSEADTYQ